MNESPRPWTMRRTPVLFELIAADGNPVMRLRGGMAPTEHDAALILAAVNEHGARHVNPIHERKPASYVIRRKGTMTIVAEIFGESPLRKVFEGLKGQYEVVPVEENIAEFNRNGKKVRVTSASGVTLRTFDDSMEAQRWARAESERTQRSLKVVFPD